MSRLLAGLWLVLLCHTAWAQTDDIVTEFKRLSPAEESSLRAILAEPVPVDALSSTLQRHFSTKEVAAQKLAELGPLLALYRQWAAVSPATVNLNNFSNELKRAGETDEALRVRKEAVDREKPGINQEMFRKNLAADLFNAGQVREAQDMLAVVHQKLQALQTQNWQGRNRLDLLRVQAETQALEAMIHNRFGAQTKAVEAATHSVDSAREALKRAQARSGTDRNDADTMRAGSTLASSLAQKKSALQAAGQYGEAEETLREFMRLAKAVDLQPRYLATLYQSAGTLRQALREFTQAERYFRKADQVLASLGYTPLSPARTGVASWTVASLEGQHRWADALAELDRLDELAKDDLAVSKRIRFPRVRGYAYLHAPLGAAARLTAAVELFRGMSADAAKWYPAHHFLVAQANGLQGVALWRTGDAQSKTKALVLLKKAVLDYMVPDNIELETADLGKDIRDLIFATYLEAVFATPGDNPMEAMGPADWVRGGMVQEALADAAVRASATDPALADLVRQDQDAKNEIEALRKYLAGGSDATDKTKAPLPDAVAQMRNRITALDSTRQKLQIETQAKFPNFDRLLRPTPPGAVDLARDLGKDEALVMLLPTDDAVFVWAISNTGGSASARVPLSKRQLARLVQGARQTLDFNAMGGQIRPFDAAAASELYQRLLVPVKGVTTGKTHLIFAAGGVLGQIPFGVLLTQPATLQSTSTLAADAPWLIRQAAITHVPSLSAWTAVKQLAKAASAPESLAAWGDPQFAGKAPATLTRASPQSPHNAASLDLDQEDTGTALRYADIPALPETRDELLAIARALQADPQRDLNLGERATKASVLQSSRSGELQRKRVVAFATHGLMAGDLPKLTQPALALAGTGNEATDPLGALLTLDEVLGLKLNADWVVLSACNTAASDGKGEEALSGLARGFFYAGSRSLLVTHWAVESESAKQLTTATFDHYTQHPQARKAESLRQAMLKVMVNPKFSHPAFWAPYALVGDGGR